MKFFTNKQFDELMKSKKLEHIEHMNMICDGYDYNIDRICELNFDLQMKINELNRELNSIENDKIRYLKMIENKSFKSKRLKKKYKDKLIREIKLLFGGE